MLLAYAAPLLNEVYYSQVETNMTSTMTSGTMTVAKESLVELDIAEETWALETGVEDVDCLIDYNNEECRDKLDCKVQWYADACQDISVSQVEPVEPVDCLIFWYKDECKGKLDCAVQWYAQECLDAVKVQQEEYIEVHESMVTE